MRLPFPFFTRTHGRTVRTDGRTNPRTQPGIIIDVAGTIHVVLPLLSEVVLCQPHVRKVGLAPCIFKVGLALHQRFQIWTRNANG